MARLPGSSAPSSSFAADQQVRKNKYAANCVKCGVRVEAEAGRLTRSLAGKWEVSHIPPCPQKAAEAPQADRSPQVTIEVSEPLYDGLYTLETPNGHRTFRLRTQAEDSAFKAGYQIVGYLNGADNERDYTSFGHFEERRLRIWKKHQANAQLVEDAERFMEDPASALKSAQCFACHRTLTVPASVHAGYGPECASRL